MSADEPFPTTFSAIAKFALQRREIECKKAIADLDVALKEQTFAANRETYTRYRKDFHRELIRVQRAIAYILNRRERERAR